MIGVSGCSRLLHGKQVCGGSAFNVGACSPKSFQQRDCWHRSWSLWATCHCMCQDRSYR
ncbi:hypothetical protein BDZ97DRAFT_1821792 [Flammula alnicola]|nr:hypothetical protein BDZ97DRAFT_1821792 [Flammula alnicola]